MEHYICTSFGNSEACYHGKDKTSPSQGILQGNGAGPGGWFAISTIIINLMKKHGIGYKEWTLIKQRAITITCFAFVDDTDLIHVNNDPDVTTDQLLVEAQEALTTWEGLLRATGGALEPSKSYCCLLYTSPSPRDLSTSRMPSSA